MSLFKKIGKNISYAFTKAKKSNPFGGKIGNNLKLASATYENKIPAGYSLDTELSSDGNNVYKDRTGKAIVSYSGTRLDKKHAVKDLATDALLALGLERYSNRFKKADKLATRAREKYGAENTTLTGGSLGGSLANYASARTGLKGEAYNSGYGLSAFNPNSYLKKSKVVSHNTLTDPISSIGLLSHAIGTNKAQTDVWHGKYFHGLNSA